MEIKKFTTKIVWLKRNAIEIADFNLRFGVRKNSLLKIK